MKRFIYILAISFWVLGLNFSNIAFAEDVYVGNYGINATGTKRIDAYLVTESISITNDVCYADVKLVYNDTDLMDTLHYAFCWSPHEQIWKYHQNPSREWFSLEKDTIPYTVFYDYVNPKRKAQMNH